MKNYKAIKEGNHYTIGAWDDGYEAYIINDGIYGYYWWDDEADAQAAAEAYNAYDGIEWLGQHGYGNDAILGSEIKKTDTKMVKLYKLFNAIDYSN